MPSPKKEGNSIGRGELTRSTRLHLEYLSSNIETRRQIFKFQPIRSAVLIHSCFSTAYRKIEFSKSRLGLHASWQQTGMLECGEGRREKKKRKKGARCLFPCQVDLHVEPRIVNGENNGGVTKFERNSAFDRGEQ